MAASKINGIILAAGLGTRLRPLTERFPKPLISVCNQPLLGHIIRKMFDAGLSELAINTHHLPEAVNSFVKALPDSSRIKLFHEPEILGTGGPLINAKALLASGDAFLLHNGDILAGIDLSSLLRKHLESGAMVTMALLDGPENRVSISPDGLVLDILGRLGDCSEKARLLTYAGVAAFSTSFFSHLPDLPVKTSLIDAFLSAISSTPGALRAFVLEPGTYWNDLGTAEQYWNAHRDILLKNSLKLGGASIPEKGALLCPEGAKLDPSAHLSGFVSLAPGCSVGEGADICNCVVLPGAHIAAGDYRCNEVIGADFSMHRDHRRLVQMRVLGDIDWPQTRISSLVEQGSDRRFYRLKMKGGRSEILLVSNETDADFGRFVQLGEFFAAHGLPTPKIFRASREEYAVRMEDLGDATICRILSKGISPDETLKLYEKIALALLHFQSGGTCALKKDAAAGIRLFDYDYLRWETSYFRERFLEKLCAFPKERCDALDAEFHLLAESARSQPQVCMHRDFQSQNILLHDSQIRFVDFQGARIGPVAYDLMSLLRDPYVALSDELRDFVSRRYWEEAARLGLVPRLEQRQYDFWAAIVWLQRGMQALGAYGFLSMVKGKTQYLRHVPRALASLRSGLSALRKLGNPELQDLPALTGICNDRLLEERARERLAAAELPWI